MFFQESNHSGFNTLFYKNFFTAFLLQSRIDFLNTSESRNKFSRRFLSDSLDAFYVVGGVSAKPLPVWNECGKKTKPSDNRFFVIQNSVVDPFLQRVDADALVVYELKGVHIAGCDNYIHIFLCF